MKPLAGRVIIEPLEHKQEESGFVMPEEKPNTGTIISVGIQKGDEVMEAAVGDVVMYGPYSGTQITVEGRDMLIMRHQEILLIF